MEILHTEDVARLLNVHKRTVQNHAKEGIYPSTVCIKYGRKYFFDKDALLAWLFTNPVQSTGMEV